MYLLILLYIFVFDCLNYYKQPIFINENWKSLNENSISTFTLCFNRFNLVIWLSERHRCGRIHLAQHVRTFVSQLFFFFFGRQQRPKIVFRNVCYLETFFLEILHDHYLELSEHSHHVLIGLTWSFGCCATRAHACT